MTTSRYFHAVALALCLSFASFAPAAESAVSGDSGARVPWEHCAFTHDLKGPQSNAEIARTINGLGKDGWELVSVANFSTDGTTTKTTYYFKRRL